MSTFKFAMWVVWISILLTIGFIVLLPLALLLIILVPIFLIGALVA
jgi:hypothetical protein